MLVIWRIFNHGPAVGDETEWTRFVERKSIVSIKDDIIASNKDNRQITILDAIGREVPRCCVEWCTCSGAGSRESSRNRFPICAVAICTDLVFVNPISSLLATEDRLT